MDLGIAGKVAIVTGSGQGIGRETALRLANEGAKVCITCRSEKAGEDTAQVLRAQGCEAVFISADISREEDVERLFSQTDRLLGPVDILVNNASISPKAPFEEITAIQFEEVLRVNAVGTLLCCQQAAARMKKAGWGRIINLSSSAAKTGSDRAGEHYVASKAAVIGLTVQLAKKLAPYGITVNCVAPGRILTGMSASLSAAQLREIAQRLPMGRIGSVAEVASAILFLASEQSSYLSGACIDIRGGSPV